MIKESFNGVRPFLALRRLNLKGMRYVKTPLNASNAIFGRSTMSWPKEGEEATGLCVTSSNGGAEVALFCGSA